MRKEGRNCWANIEEEDAYEKWHLNRTVIDHEEAAVETVREDTQNEAGDAKAPSKEEDWQV